MTEPDYYMDLGVDPKANQQEIEKVYQKLAAANPKNTNEQSKLAWTHYSIGVLYAETGRHDQARGPLEQSRALRQSLADAHPVDFSSLRLVISAGSSVPRSLIEAFQYRHRVRIVQGWGMTETSPIVTVAHPPKDCPAESDIDFRALAGRG